MNDSVFINQLAGLLRALGPIAVGLLIKWGLPEAAAGPFVDWGIMVLAGLAAAGWSWFANKRSEVVKRAATTEGVKITVDHTAPEEVKAVAKDPDVPSIAMKKGSV